MGENTRRPSPTSSSSVAQLFAARARVHPDRVALTWSGTRRTYAEVRDRVARLAGLLRDRGVGPGDRVAVISRNRPEYLELFLAAGSIGAVVACQNWRLADPELTHCLDLVAPTLLVASEDLAPRWDSRPEPRLCFGAELEEGLAQSGPVAPVDVDPEDPFLILYTSGTTGLPKGAVISHRAEVARFLQTRAELPIAPEDATVAWSPLYHMGGAEYSLATLMAGGTVHVVEGFDGERLAELVATERLGWLLLMPGMVGRFADRLEADGTTPRGVQVCGVMADLVPPDEIARITRLLDAPYVNTFGATETGNPPCSAGLLPIGEVPEQLSKVQSLGCEVRLVGPDGEPVPDGTPGEILVRGPTLFSGYWAAPDATAEVLRDGWYHMGDVFVRNADGTLDFVDRVKYLIKSGGENIYPAEIERVLLRDPRVAEAAVVRRPDPRWGEVPVAFVARADEGLSAEALGNACRSALAGYKQPKAIHFIDFDDFPRSASGKIQRHELEKRLEAHP